MRPRARPSFTVEIKRNRSGQNPDPRAADPWWGSDLRNQLALEAEPILLAEAPERAAEASPSPSGPRGRILPNLLNREIVAEAPEIPAEDTPAPRRGRKPGAPRPAPSASRAADADWAYGPVVEVRPVPRPALPAEPPEAGLSPPRMQARAARGGDEAALKPGERWKRRLPRVLW